MQVLTNARPASLPQSGLAHITVRVSAAGPQPLTRTIVKAAKLQQDSARFQQDGNLSEAEARCRVALDLVEQEQGPASADAANILHSLGEILCRRRKFAEAEACAHRAAIIIEYLLPQLEGPEGMQILIASLALLGTALREQGRYAEAEAPVVRAIQLGRGLPNLTGALIEALNEYGVLCKVAGWFENGEIVYRRAFELALKLHGGNSETMATLLHNLGALYHAAGRFNDAEEHARRGLQIRRSLLGDVHSDVLSDAVAYGAILDSLGRFGESRPIYERAVAEYTLRFGPENYEMAVTLHHLAGVERAQGNMRKAEKLANRALVLKQKILGVQHPDTAFSAMHLGFILSEAGREEEARALFTSALAIFERTLAQGHPNVTKCRKLLADEKKS